MITLTTSQWAKCSVPGRAASSRHIASLRTAGA